MGLKEYWKKRDFAVTPEPAGAEHTPGGNRFVIQKHAARRLHYDFRLELDGVLLSWAVPKGPSLDPADKRLAVHTEDHPIEYGDFEGVIPKGEYGGGTVLLWDRGRWFPEGDPREGYRKGRLEFRLEGEKLHGGWKLVRTRTEGDKEQWLLIKTRDDRVDEDGEAVVRERAESVATGRSLDEIAQDKDRVWDGKLGEVPPEKPALPALPGKVAPMPTSLPPALCTPAKEAPAGDDWISEIKLDGYRAMAWLKDGTCRMLTRSGLDWTARFRDIARAIEALPLKDAILDGEVVALDRRGISDFGGLQRLLGDEPGDPGAVAMKYFAFDLLYADGRDLRGEPLIRRKEALQAVLTGARDVLRYTDHVSGDGPAFFQHACGMGLEGSIAKRAASPYRSGRGKDWLKIKCQNREDFVVVGYTDPEGARSRFGALALALRDGDALRYVGRVGAGFSEATLRQVHDRLRPRATPPVVDPPGGAEGRGLHWVEPDLEAEVNYTEWTRDGRLRHPTFKGLKVPTSEPPVLSGGDTVAGVKLSNPGRVLWDDTNVTKLELARYYERVAERMLPHFVQRPLTLLRCPNGVGRPCFYQRHRKETLPPTVHGVVVPGRGDDEAYVWIDSVEGLVTLVQLGSLELHPWGARVDRPDRPDRLVFDLDPDPGLGWERLVEGALLLKERLAQLGLDSWPRTTGGKGLHVVVPIDRTVDWDTAKEFTRRVAEDVVRRHPDRYTARIAKVQRKGKIFIDWLRNAQTATAVGTWSTRARPGAPIAAPLGWEEILAVGRGDRYNVRNATERLERPDPWADFLDARQAMTAGARRDLGME